MCIFPKLEWTYYKNKNNKKISNRFTYNGFLFLTYISAGINTLFKFYHILHFFGRSSKGIIIRVLNSEQLTQIINILPKLKYYQSQSKNRQIIIDMDHIKHLTYFITRDIQLLLNFKDKLNLYLKISGSDYLHEILLDIQYIYICLWFEYC